MQSSYYDAEYMSYQKGEELFPRSFMWGLGSAAGWVLVRMDVRVTALLDLITGIAGDDFEQSVCSTLAQ